MRFHTTLYLGCVRVLSAGVRLVYGGSDIIIDKYRITFVRPDLFPAALRYCIIRTCYRRLSI